MGSFSVDGSSITLISVADLETMELGTAIQLVQGQRAALLEDQLKDQLKEVQDRNRKVDELNSTLSSARELMAQFGPEDKTGKKISDLIKDQSKELAKTDEWKNKNEQYKASQLKENNDKTTQLNSVATQINTDLDDQEKEIKIEWQKSRATNGTTFPVYLHKTLNPANAAGKEYRTLLARQTEVVKNLAALENFSPENLDPIEHTKAGKFLENLKSSATASGMKIDTNNKGELQTLVENIKSQIDTLSNTQQLDMLRLQNYSSKYNETFEARTNMLKQAHELNSKILNNTRGT